MIDNAPGLGSCCGCETAEGVRNVICLPLKSPLPGRGWGCVVCNLSPDGAMAVLCDYCAELYMQQLSWGVGTPGVLRFACRGYPGRDGRVAVGELTGLHAHDMRYHADEEQGHTSYGIDEEDW